LGEELEKGKCSFYLLFFFFLIFNFYKYIGQN
jgi:hypothetical protein